jgi:hypothetical protein
MLDEKNAMNLSLSSRGTAGFEASARTRPLKESQLISLLINELEGIN